jgi:hypothetical protein
MHFTSVLSTVAFALAVFAQSEVGWTGRLSSLSGGLEGEVSVINSDTLVINNYELQDASAPALYWWGSTTTTLKDGFRISNMHITQTQTSPTNITIDLNAGKTASDFSTVGLYCEQFGVDFGQTTLSQTMGGSSSSVSASPTSPSAASSTTSAAATTATTASSGGSSLQQYLGILFGASTLVAVALI